MADSIDSPAPSLSLLRTLHPPTSGPTRSWQSTPHPDPSTPLLATASADKTVNVWSLRDFSLVSTISGGHKRSVRAVDWKDFGQAARGPRSERKPVVLGTGSFDANVGVWVWNDDRRWARFKDGDGDGDSRPQQQGGGGNAPSRGEDSTMTDDLAMDLTQDEQDPEQDEDDEEWHFSTLLTGPDSEIKSIAFSPPHYPANWLATSSRDKSVWIWEEVEPEEWETIAVLSEHTGDVKCVSWCAGARKGCAEGREAKRRKLVNPTSNDEDVDMAEEHRPQVNGTITQTGTYEKEEAEDQVIGSRDILASGSYDDTIRLWRDVEEEGDWICVGVIDEHKGTVWDVKWEPHINYSALDLSSTQLSTQEKDKAIEAFENDWEPRLISCSDDLTVRLFRRELSQAEKEKKQHQLSPSQGVAVPTGFASSRLPSVIRPPSSLEHWTQEAVLPEVHVRSVYAIDWSRNTGLVVSCGGDGTIAVYKEIPIRVREEDVVMNGTTPQPFSIDEAETNPILNSQSQHDLAASSHPYTLHKTKWIVIAVMESAHDEYEINHVCWAVRKDKDCRFDGEEVIVSTGDEGDVRVWTLPEDVLLRRVS